MKHRDASVLGRRSTAERAHARRGIVLRDSIVKHSTIDLGESFCHFFGLQLLKSSWTIVFVHGGRLDQRAPTLPCVNCTMWSSVFLSGNPRQDSWILETLPRVETIGSTMPGAPNGARDCVCHGGFSYSQRWFDFWSLAPHCLWGPSEERRVVRTLRIRSADQERPRASQVSKHEDFWSERCHWNGYTPPSLGDYGTSNTPGIFAGKEPEIRENLGRHPFDLSPPL